MPTNGPSGRRPQKPETQSQPIREHLPGTPPKETGPDLPRPHGAQAIYIVAIVAIAAVITVGMWANS